MSTKRQLFSNSARPYRSSTTTTTTTSNQNTPTTSIDWNKFKQKSSATSNDFGRIHKHLDDDEDDETNYREDDDETLLPNPFLLSTSKQSPISITPHLPSATSSSRRIIFTGSKNYHNKKRSDSAATAAAAHKITENNSNNAAAASSSSLTAGATLQETLLSVKVAELSDKLKQANSDKDSLMKSLRQSIRAQTEAESRLASVTEMLAATTAKFKKDGERENRFIDAATQAPDILEESAFAHDLERSSLYQQHDVRAALMSLLDRHDDVKQLLLRSSWLMRNSDYSQRFPSHVNKIRACNIEYVNHKRPATAETIQNANTTPRAELLQEMSELTRRSHPKMRHMVRKQ